VGSFESDINFINTPNEVCFSLVFVIASAPCGAAVWSGAAVRKHSLSDPDTKCPVSLIYAIGRREGGNVDWIKG